MIVLTCLYWIAIVVGVFARFNVLQFYINRIFVRDGLLSQHDRDLVRKQPIYF